MGIVSALWIMLFTSLVLIVRKKNILFLPLALQMFFSSMFLIATNLSPGSAGFIAFFIFVFLVFLSIILYIYCLASMMLKRRSTLNIDELTELRG